MSYWAIDIWSRPAIKQKNVPAHPAKEMLSAHPDRGRVGGVVVNTRHPTNMISGGGRCRLITCIETSTFLIEFPRHTHQDSTSGGAL